MKKIYIFWLMLSGIFFINKVNAQITLLNDNHSLSGAPIGNNKIILISDVDSTLWISDGTAANTNQYAFNVKVDDNGGGGILNNKIYFAGIDATHGSELWVSDGTSGGTSLVSDLVAGAGNSTPDNFFLFKNDLYFTANTPALGRELYKISGSTGTLSFFKDINPGAGSSISSTDDFFEINNLMYFTADNGTTGKELWVSDGTGVNTNLLADITPGATGTNFGVFSHLGNEVIFSITNPSFSFDIWKTNGTTAGTSLVKSFNVSGSYITNFLPFNNKLYFSGTDAANGAELWSTDGTTTEMIKDINTGSNSSLPQLFNAVIINNHIIFSASTDANGNELWISDGIKNGSTVMLKDINPGTSDGSPIIYPVINILNLVNGAGTLDELYNRTQLYNGYIFFSADNGTNGRELWKTDGTAGNTILVKDINPGLVGGLENTGAYYYTSTGLYFAANDGTTGNEPWVSNGSLAGTNRVADLNPGTNGSDPSFYFIQNGSLFFTADNGNSVNNYTDFYKINGPLSELPITLLNFSAMLQSDAVQLAWATSSEINSSHFEIQRSTDGQNFTNIAQEEAAGNSAVKKNYGYNDDNAYEAGSNVLFYRLRMVDLDGKFKYSNVLNVRLKGAITEMKIYPNPVHNQLSVSLNIASAKNVKLRITGVSGKQYYNQTYHVGGNTSSLQNIDVSRLAKGTYFVQLITETESKIVKFVKE